MKKLLAAVAVWSLLAPVSAQDVYPSRAITIVVPFGPGSGTDVGARLVAQKLSDALGKPVVVANELSLATGNASGVVMSETLARQVGWKLLRVPFKSNPQAMTEVVAGRVQSMFTDIAAASAQIKAGTLRPIVVTSKQRSALMPD